MQKVRIINGKHFRNKDSIRIVDDIVFPVFNSEITTNDKGSFIQVDGAGIKGFPGGKFKIYIDGPQSFQVFEDGDYYDRAYKLNEKVGKHSTAPTIVPTLIAEAVTESLILRGPDDNEIKERINERFFVLKQLVWAAADGDVTGLVVSGPPGVGKSFGVEEALEHGENNLADVMDALTATSSDAIDPDAPLPTVERKEKIHYKVLGGHMSPMTLYETLYQYKEKRNVLVFDDCDSVLYNEQSLNILKKALDSGPKRVIDWGSNALSRSGNNTPDRFTFEGSVIFISNINFDRPKSKSSALTEHLHAIMSRVYYVDLTMNTLRDKFLRIEHVCKDFGIIQQAGLSPEEVDEVMEFFETNIHNFREVSIRTVQKIATMKRLHAGKWQSWSKITTFKTVAQ